MQNMNVSRLTKIAGAVALFAALVVPGSGFAITKVAEPKPVDQGAVAQLSNLVVDSVSGTTLPATITAHFDGAQNCFSFTSTRAAKGSPAPCPSIMPSVGYRISVTTQTILLLKNRQKATLADFAIGDHINVYGFLSAEDGSMEALILRNIDKPISRNELQISNARVTEISDQDDVVKTITIFQSKERGCKEWSGRGGSAVTIRCPIIGDFGAGRTYVVGITSETSLMDKFRHPIAFGDINIGDTVNVYGFYVSSSPEKLDGKIVRDLSIPRPSAVPVIKSLTGPTVLKVGVTGKWTIRAYDPLNRPLTYSVDWGDATTTSPFGLEQNKSVKANSQTATFSHAYSAEGTYTISFKVTNSDGGSADASISVTVTDAETRKVSIAGATSQSGVVGVAFSDDYEASGGTWPYSWTTSGTLPPGIALNPVYETSVCSATDVSCARPVPKFKVARLEGAPTTAGTYRFVVKVTDSNDVSASKTVVMKVSLLPTTFEPTISKLSPSSGIIGTSVTIYGTNFTRAGNKVYLGASIASGNLSSKDGTSLTFTVPISTDPPCVHATPACLLPSQMLVHGTYSVFVKNSNGTSNAVNFMVIAQQSSAKTLKGVAFNPEVTPYGTAWSWVYSDNPSDVKGQVGKEMRAIKNKTQITDLALHAPVVYKPTPTANLSFDWPEPQCDANDNPDPNGGYICSSVMGDYPHSSTINNFVDIINDAYKEGFSVVLFLGHPYVVKKSEIKISSADAACGHKKGYVFPNGRTLFWDMPACPENNLEMSKMWYQKLLSQLNSRVPSGAIVYIALSGQIDLPFISEMNMLNNGDPHIASFQRYIGQIVPAIQQMTDIPIGISLLPSVVTTGNQTYDHLTNLFSEATGLTPSNFEYIDITSSIKLDVSATVAMLKRLGGNSSQIVISDFKSDKTIASNSSMRLDDVVNWHISSVANNSLGGWWYWRYRDGTSPTYMGIRANGYLGDDCGWKGVFGATNSGSCSKIDEGASASSTQNIAAMIENLRALINQLAEKIGR